MLDLIDLVRRTGQALLSLLGLELKLGKLLGLGLKLLGELPLLLEPGLDILLNCRKLRLCLLACCVGRGELLIGGRYLRLQLNPAGARCCSKSRQAFVQLWP